MWTTGVQGFDTLPYWERETEHEIQHQTSGKDTVCQVKDGAMCSRLQPLAAEKPMDFHVNFIKFAQMAIHCWWLYNPIVDPIFQWTKIENRVGGLEHFFFSIYWECHHPNWLIFFRGVGQPPTRNLFIKFILLMNPACFWNGWWNWRLFTSKSARSMSQQFCGRCHPRFGAVGWLGIFRWLNGYGYMTWYNIIYNNI